MKELEKTDFSAKARENLREKKFPELKEMFSSLTGVDAAAVIGEMELVEAAAIFRLLPKEEAAAVLVELSPERQEKLIAAFSDRELAPILDEMFADELTDLLEEMPANVVKRILKNTDPDTRLSVNELLKFPKNCTGAVMTTEFVDLKREMTVEQALERIRQTGPDKETVYTCYVTSPDRHLLGVLGVKELLFAERNARVEELMEENVIAVSTETDREETAKLFDRYDFLALPVTDREGRLVGIVTVDDAMDVMQKENTEDFEKMAAIRPSEKGYFEVSVVSHAANRILWLLFLMLSATFTGAVISRYENAFSALPVLVAMIPMLMDTGGNCGSQASVMVIRGLALGEIKPKDFFKVWWKEIRIALLVGAVLAAVNFGRVALFYPHAGIPVVKLALITGLTLVLEILLAKTLGCALPMLAKAVKLDPAIMAAPLITTMVDACSVLLYFTVACKILGIVL